jgi:hypothetical protein
VLTFQPLKTTDSARTAQQTHTVSVTKNQSVDAVQWNNPCSFCNTYKRHIGLYARRRNVDFLSVKPGCNTHSDHWAFKQEHITELKLCHFGRRYCHLVKTDFRDGHWFCHQHLLKPDIKYAVCRQHVVKLALGSWTSYETELIFYEVTVFPHSGGVKVEPQHEIEKKYWLRKLRLLRRE